MRNKLFRYGYNKQKGGDFLNMKCMKKSCLPSKKICLISLGAVGAAMAIGVGSLAIYNSKQMRAMRIAKRTGKILYKMGSVLQAASGAVEVI